ncbi:MAG: hypothetical protein H0V89_13040, partial [Deltaproteobacteria bacterium]|nr:hypothetical protein [Deltaproteobacteria bacterium]
MRRTDTLLRLAALAPLLLTAGEAFARVGGGEGYGRPSGGGGGGGGGGEGLGDLVFLLVWLCIEFPLVGIPLVLIVIGVVIARVMFGAVSGARATVRTTSRSGASNRPPGRQARRTAGLDVIAAADPGFSLPVLLDFLVLVHRRAWEAGRTGTWEPLIPYVAESARPAFAPTEGWQILEVIPGAVRPHRAEIAGGYTHLHVRFETTRLEKSLANQREQRFLVEEEWTLRRKTGAVTRAPDLVMRLGCPSCGNA